jgi:hypothetical protein
MEDSPTDRMIHRCASQVWTNDKDAVNAPQRKDQRQHAWNASVLTHSKPPLILTPNTRCHINHPHLALFFLSISSSPVRTLSPSSKSQLPSLAFLALDIPVMSQNPPSDNVAQPTTSESEEEEEQVTLIEKCRVLIDRFNNRQAEGSYQPSMLIPTQLVGILSKLFNRYQLRFDNYKKLEDEVKAKLVGDRAQLAGDRAQLDREIAEMEEERGRLEQKANTMKADHQIIDTELTNLTGLKTELEAFVATREEKLSALETQRVELQDQIGKWKEETDALVQKRQEKDQERAAQSETALNSLIEKMRESDAIHAIHAARMEEVNVEHKQKLNALQEMITRSTIPRTSLTGGSVVAPFVVPRQPSSSAPSGGADRLRQPPSDSAHSSGTGSLASWRPSKSSTVLPGASAFAPQNPSSQDTSAATSLFTTNLLDRARASFTNQFSRQSDTSAATNLPNRPGDKRSIDLTEADSRPSSRDGQPTSTPQPHPHPPITTTESVKKHKGDGAALTVDELFGMMEVVDDPNQNPPTRKPATALSANLKAMMLSAGDLEKFRFTGEKWYKILNSNPKKLSCAHAAAAKVPAAQMAVAWSTCTHCVKQEGQVCIKKTPPPKNSKIPPAPLILPLHANDRQGKGYEDIDFWRLPKAAVAGPSNTAAVAGPSNTAAVAGPPNPAAAAGPSNPAAGPSNPDDDDEPL